MAPCRDRGVLEGGTEGYLAFAPDGLTGVGGYPGEEEKDAAAFRKVGRTKTTENFIAATRWLKALTDCDAKLGVVGF